MPTARDPSGAAPPSSPSPARPSEPVGQPREVRWLRWSLWALLVMVLLGLLLVWWRAGGASQPAVLGEVPGFRLVDQHGAVVSHRDLAGSPWVADLIFTRCTLSCPRMTERMRALGALLPAAVRRVSISVDPDHDTSEVLAAYASSQRADWTFLTGERQEIWELAIGGFKLGVSETPADDPRALQEPITHSTRFVLVDDRGRIRGYYDGFDGEAVRQLVRDARRLAELAARR